MKTGKRYIFLILSILAIAIFMSGCIDKNSNALSNNNTQKEKNHYSNAYVLIEYGYKSFNKIQNGTVDEFVYPKPGNLFLTISTNMTNVGYPVIIVTPSDWYLSISTTDNPNYVDIDKFDDNLHNLDVKDVYIKNGDSIKGHILFEIPKNWKNIELQYGPVQGYNVRWKLDKSR